MSIHYTDLVVDEIPYIACKNNPAGHHVVDRIPLNVDYGSNVSYEPYRDPYQNYFLPISLNKLTIKLTKRLFQFSLTLCLLLGNQQKKFITSMGLQMVTHALKVAIFIEQIDSLLKPLGGK